MKRWCIPLVLALVVLISFSCKNGGGTPEPTPTATPTLPVTPTPQITITPETFIGNPSTCETGDVGRLPFLSDSTARFTLNDGTCAPAKNNTKEEYTIMLYNTTDANISFRISSPADVDPFGEEESAAVGGAEARPLVSQVDQAAYDYHKSLIDENSPSLPTLKRGSSYSLAKVNYDVGDEMEYKIRCDYDNANVFCTESAILRATGDHIEVWVDTGVPYNDGNADHLAEADLTNIVNVYENNIYPLESTLLGSNCSTFDPLPCPVSNIDVDEDNPTVSKVTVIITPVLNWLPTTAGDPGSALLPSVYVDTRNLEPFNEFSNAGSNEQEMIFLYAPDELGYFNNREPVDKDYWVNKAVYAWLAVGLEKLISYNFHVFLNGGNVEEAWIDFGLGGVFADLAGFNIWPTGIWHWLDAPAYETIKTSSDFGCSRAMAGPYLFMSYLVQSQMDETLEETLDDGGSQAGLLDADLAFLSNFMSEFSGTVNLENAIEFEYDEDVETEFEALFKNWAVALTTSGTGRSDLQTSSEFAYYFVSSSGATMTIPDSRLYGAGIAALDGDNDVVSQRYGANGASPDHNAKGNPVGIDLNGRNYTDDELDGTFALVENPHEFTYAPGNKLYGIVYPFTSNFIRVGGLFEETTDVVITASTPLLKGFIARRTDLPEADGYIRPRVYSENIFGSLNPDPEVLNQAGANSLWPVKLDYPYYSGTHVGAGNLGETVTIVGHIDTTDLIPVWDEDCNFSYRDVPDFDKYQITIPDVGDSYYVGTEQRKIAIWIERQADGVDGQSTLVPMLAVVSWDDIPYPDGRYTDSSDPNSARTGDRMEYRWLGVRSTEFGSSITESSAVDFSRDGVGECDDFLTAYPALDLESPSPIPDGTNHFGYCYLNWETYRSTWATGGIADVMYDREILKPVPADAFISDGPETRHFDPRTYNLANLDCDDTNDDEERITTDPDDLLSASELRRPSKFQEQIFIEMSRATAPDDEASSNGNYDANLTPDTLAVDVDSRDTDSAGYFTEFDSGNNVGGRSVVNGENSMLIVCDPGEEPAAGYCNDLAPHIWRQLHGSDVSTQLVYNYDVAGGPPSGYPHLYLEPGKTYMILVGGVGETTGAYELRLRKILPANIEKGQVEVSAP